MPAIPAADHLRRRTISPIGFLSTAAGTARANLSALRSFIDPGQVGYLILYVTNRCNFRCDFCFYAEEIDKGLKPDELTVDELVRISEKMGPLLQLSMTGGEPFLRDEFEEITRAFIENTRPRYITIPTNASLTKRMVRYLESVLPDYPHSNFRLAFSIEGIGQEHDDIRSMPGSFNKIRESYDAISPLRDRFPNLVLDCNSVFTARSEVTLLQTLDTLSQDFQFDNMSVTYARGDPRDPELKKTSDERYLEIHEFLRGIERAKESRFLSSVWRGVNDVSRESLIRTVIKDEFVSPCVAGRKLIVLSETGEVFPCEILGKTMGNIRGHDHDIKALLAQSENDELRKWIVDTQCKCSFECALAANVVWNYSTYPRLARSVLENVRRT